MADVTITQATAMHELSATTPDNPAAEIRPSHWNAAHGATVVLAASAMLALFGNANGFSFDTSNGSIVGSYTVPNVPAQSVQTQAAGNIARTGFTTTTVAGDKIAATHNTDGLLMAVPAYLTTYAAQSVQTQAAGAIAGTGATTATTAGTEIKVTLNTAGISMGVPAYLTAAGAGGGAGTGFTTTTVAGDKIAGTHDAAGLLLAVPAYLTTYAAQTVQTQASGNIPRSGFTTTATNGSVIVGTHDTDGLKLGVPPYLTTARASTDAVGLNTALTANGVAWTVNSSGISLNVPAYLTTARGSTDAVGLNTALTANGVSWTVNSSGISLNVPAFLTTAANSTHSHGNPTLALTNLSGTTASASNGFTLSLSAAAPGGGAAATVSVLEIMDGARLTTAAAWNNGTYSRRPIFVPFDVDVALSGCHTIRILASRSSGTQLVATMFAGIYSRVDATSASRISSTSFNVSHSTSALHSGVRMYDFTGLGALSLAPGRYLLALMASVAATNDVPLHLMGGDAIPALAGFVNSGTNASAATATNSHIIPMWGVYSATSAGLPANVAASEISGGGSQNSPDVYAIIKAI